MLVANGLQVDGQRAHQPLDHVAPQPVVGRQRHAPRGRQSSRLDGAPVVGERGRVLNVPLRQGTDRGCAEADQDGRVINGITLEIAPKPAGFQSRRKVVGGQGEMVETDLPETALAQPPRRRLELAEPLGPPGSSVSSISFW